MSERIHDRDVRQAYWNAQAAHDRYYKHFEKPLPDDALPLDFMRHKTEAQKLEDAYASACGQLLAVLHARIGDPPPGPPTPPPMPFKQFA